MILTCFKSVLNQIIAFNIKNTSLHSTILISLFSTYCKDYGGYGCYDIVIGYCSLFY